MSSSNPKVIPGLSKGRLESLTDGIFGTVMTVLILSLSVPIIITSPSTSIAFENIQLLISLRSLLPDILSYVISFAILGAFWIRHHTMFYFVSRVDRLLLWINIIFLLTIGFIPFSTALIGRYPNLQLSLIVYGANLMATSITSQGLWRYSVAKKLVIQDDVDEKIMGRINARMSAGPIAYLIGIIVSFSNPPLTLGIYIVTLLFFIFNSGSTFRIWKRRVPN